MKNLSSKNNLWIYIGGIFLAIVLLYVIVVKLALSNPLDNNVEVEENSTLTYYLEVSYDGVDKNGVRSNDTTISEVKSGELVVEDRIPDGLTFTGFVTTSDGSIGAVKRSDGTSCLGKVIDDTNEDDSSTGEWNAGNTEFTYHGLHYTVSDRKVKFKIKNLKAGCKLTVGVITTTPTIDDPLTTEVEKRRDFYNFATAREQGLTVNSNTVHVFMGKENVTLYDVSYQYTGTVPSNAPSVPNTNSYIEGDKVGVAPSVYLEGYTFNGWTTSNATVSNGSFSMPNNNVTFTGSFTENSKFNVTYTITGTTPSGYVTPAQKSYYPDSTIKLDVLKAGDVVNGYRFLGWTTTDASVNSDNEFTMPTTNVTLRGEFEEVTYNVSYQFYDTVLPPNASNYLPATVSYKPGQTVTLASIDNFPEGYRFLGWYKENEFIMPENDVIVYGEWAEQAGEFDPSITKTLNSTKTYFAPGDRVPFNITITNNSSYAIHDVIVKEEVDNGTFVSGTGYTILSDHVANVTSIPANSSVTLYAVYVVGASESGTITNTASIKGALADNGYTLKEGNYVASDSFKVKSKLKVCKNVTSNYNENTFQFLVTGVSVDYETWITLEDDECETIYVSPGTYKVHEIVPQEYTLSSVVGGANQDNTTFTIAENTTTEITYTNAFAKKGFLHSFGRVVNKILSVGGGN